MTQNHHYSDLAFRYIPFAFGTGFGNFGDASEYFVIGELCTAHFSFAKHKHKNGNTIDEFDIRDGRLLSQNHLDIRKNLLKT